MSRTDPTTYRDEELGNALRRLDVPDHAPEFFADLERLLAAEPAHSPSRLTRTRRVQLRWGLRIAAAAAIVAVALAVLGLPETERTPSLAGPEEATAAVVKARVQASLQRLRTLGGVIVADGSAQGGELRWRFVLDAQGDFRLTGPARGEAITYDASDGLARSAQHSASLGGDAIFYAERRGVAPGPPDQGPPTWVLPDELGAYVRALLAAGDPRVREIDYEGRPAWWVDVDTVPNSIVPAFSGDRLEITVDRATGIPVRVVESRAGAVLRQLRIQQLAVDRPVDTHVFRLSFPPAAEVTRSDEGFRRVSLDEVPGIVGYAPLVPARVPDGFELADVAAATESGATGTGAGNPPSRMVVALAYRRGLDRFLVTTRLASTGRWSDPLATGEGLADRPDSVGVDSGALRGASARLVLTPRGTPHLWSVSGGLVVTVAGDLTRDELVSVAGSLQARP